MFIISGRGNDHPVLHQFILRPVGRNGHLPAVEELEPFDHAQQLVEVSTQLLRIVKNRMDLVLIGNHLGAPRGHNFEPWELVNDQRYSVFPNVSPCFLFSI